MAMRDAISVDAARLLNALKPEVPNKPVVVDSPQTQSPIELVATRNLCEDSLYHFVQKAWNHIESSPFVDNWHIKMICDHLEAVTKGTISRLLINIPPGCSKSLLVSVFWPMWEWAKDPSIRWFFASYDQRLSTRDSVRCRALLESVWYQALWGDKFQLIHDQNQKMYYETDKRGYRLATSIGGHGTGEHPDRVVVDDAHNVEQAESDLERQNVLDWWNQTMTTRGVSRNVRQVIIMQRLHTDDLAGHVIKKGDWVCVILPMRYEEGRMKTTPLGWNDPRQREGELLTPNLFDEEKVRYLEKNLGIYGSAGQLQQRPTPRGGGMFRIEFFNQTCRAAPFQCQRVRSWDRSATEGAGCYSAGTLMGESPEGNIFVENVVHGQWEPDRRDDIILATAISDRRRYGPHHEPVILIEHEPGSAGVDAYKYTARKLAGFHVRPFRPTGKKEVRAEPWASQCAAKNIWLVDDGTWDVQGWIEEHCAFPMAKIKDRVDSASQGFTYLANRRRAGSLRSYALGSSRRGKLLRIVICSPTEVAGLLIEDHTCLLIRIVSPVLEMSAGISGDERDVEMPIKADEPLVIEKEVMCNAERAPTFANVQGLSPVCLQVEGGLPSPLPCDTSKLLGSLELPFLDVEPSQHQEKWDEPLAPWGKPARDLMLTRETGRKLWYFLARHKDPAPEVIVIVGEERLAQSLALAMVDAFHLPRNQTLYSVRKPDFARWHERQPDNQHVYDIARASRDMVVS